MRVLILIYMIMVFPGQSGHAQSFSNDMSKVDPKLWMSLKYWKSKEDSLSFQVGHSRELFGKVIACAGECELYRSFKPMLLKDGGNIYEGDEIRVFEDSHLWLVTMAGDLFRLYPNTSLSLNEINFSNNKVMSYLRVNKGGITRIKRETNYESYYPGPDSDQKVLPLKYSEANYSYWMRASAKTSSIDRFHFLNKIMNKAKNYESLVYLVASNINLKTKKSNFHFYHQDRGASYWFFENNQYSGFTRSYQDSKIKPRSEKWQSVSPDGTKITNYDVLKSVELGFNQLTEKIAAIKIARELILKDIWLKKDSGVASYLDWLESNYLKRMVFLDSYTQRIERSFLTSSLKLNTYSDESFSLASLLRASSLDQDTKEFKKNYLQNEVKKMGELEYKLWASSRARVR